MTVPADTQGDVTFLTQTFEYAVEPVFGWLFGAWEYWTGDKPNVMELFTVRDNFEAWIGHVYYGWTPCDFILCHEEVCELWLIRFILGETDNAVA